MRGRDQLPLRIIDLLGGSVVAACAFGFVWFVAVGNDRTGSEIRKFTALIANAQRDAQSLQLAQAQQRATLEGHRLKLAERGQLPVKAPIEEYFRTLSALCARHHLRVIHDRPLPSRSYPGLLEQRYAYEVAGSTLDLVRFLKAIEDTDFWADVSYLTVAQGTGAGRARGSTSRGVSETSRATLTISMFSAAPPASSSTGEDA